MSDDQSVEERFAAETASVTDPSSEPIVSEIFTPGTEPEPDQTFPLESFITEEFIAAILSLPGAIMARRTGDEWWRPDDDEAELLGKGGAPAARYLVSKYLNDSSGPFAALGMVLGAVYAPKVMRSTIERKRKKRRSAEPPPTYQPSAESQPSSDYEAAENPTSSSGSAVMQDE